MPSNVTTDRKAFAHFIDNVIQLELSSDVRTFFGQQGIGSMENFVHVIDYKDFYPTIYEEPTALSRLGLMDQLVIKHMYVTCHLWRQLDPEVRGQKSFPPAAYWIDEDCSIYTASQVPSIQSRRTYIHVSIYIRITCFSLHSYQ